MRPKSRASWTAAPHFWKAATACRWLPVKAGDNYVTILQRSFGIMNCTIARMGIQLCPPDILVDLPFDSYHGVYGYTHAAEIVERGRALMKEALDRYEGRNL